MKTITLTRSCPRTLRKTAGFAIAFAGAALLLHDGLLALSTLRAQAAALSFAMMLLLALAAVSVIGSMARIALQPKPAPLAVPALRRR